MSQKRFIRVAALAMGTLLLCACPEIDLPDDGPDGPDGPDPPTQTFFSISSSGKENPTFLLLGWDSGQILKVRTNADTNPDEWQFSATAPWCHAAVTSTDYVVESSITVSADPWGKEDEYLWPRSCELTVNIPGLYKETIKIVQESNLYLRIGNYSYKGIIPPSGAPVDFFVDTNLYDWQIENDLPWLKAVKLDHMTLQLSVEPRTDGTGEGRWGDIYLYSTKYDHHPENQEGPVVTFRAIEGEADLSGDDYEYGDGYLWD